MSLMGFEQAMLESLFFAEVDDDGKPLDDNFSPGDLSGAGSHKLEKLAESFYKKYQSEWGGHISDNQAGHDFALSLNGHGAGFFDNDELPKATRDALQKAARSAGPVHLYEQDNGEIGVM